uniref:LITAF domain-containing protein n=1 Tax=Acrobeloides nanus TaxID=290746 RepID=A0A914DXX4_9BILA
MAEPPPPYEGIYPPLPGARKFDDVAFRELCPPGGIPPVPSPSDTVTFDAPPRPPSPYPSAPQPPPLTVPPPPHITVLVGLPLGCNPAALECPQCRSRIVTNTVPRAGLMTWLVCGGLALMGCWPCCLIPFCVQTCMDIEHYCPGCKAFLGAYKRI